jgi:uncharacterized membrane protein YedE/YeeE
MLTARASWSLGVRLARAGRLARRRAGPFVAEAFFAALLRSLALWRAAAVSACFDSACRDAVPRGSRRSAPAIARERRPEVRLCLRPRAMS